MKRGRYYLSRVVKHGELNQDRLLAAIRQAPVVPIGEFEWTVTDMVDQSRSTAPFIFGNLAKYSKEGRVKAIVEAAYDNFFVSCDCGQGAPAKPVVWQTLGKPGRVRQAA